MKKDKNEFWEEGYFAETISNKEMKEKMSTFHKKHDEDMNFTCRKCGSKISAHNKDWHDGMCDGCFNKAYYPDDKEEQKTIAESLKQRTK